MVGVKHLPHQEQKPLLPQPPCIDTLLALENDLELLLDILPAAPNHLADGLQAVIHETLTADIQNKKLLHHPVGQDAIEKGIPRLIRHLPPSIMLKDLNLSPDAQEERVLAEGEATLSALPRLELAHQVRVVEQRHVEITRSEYLARRVDNLAVPVAGAVGPVGQPAVGVAHVVGGEQEAEDLRGGFDLPVFLVDDLLLLLLLLLGSLRVSQRGVERGRGMAGPHVGDETAHVVNLALVFLLVLPDQTVGEEAGNQILCLHEQRLGIPGEPGHEMVVALGGCVGHEPHNTFDDDGMPA